MNWIIGDVHGMLREFESVLAQIDEKDPDAQIWCVGDFCDRGYDSKGVVDLILARGEKIKCVRGNHDDVFHSIITCGPTELSDNQHDDSPLESLEWFMNYGMTETFASYGKSKDDLRKVLRTGTLSALRELVSCVPQSHIDFYTNLPLALHGDGFFIAHASVEPNTTVEDMLQYIALRKAMIWGRFAKSDIDAKKSWGKVGYFGHTPTFTTYQSKTPVFGQDIVLVDTGAVFGNCLSAVCHETKEVVASSHESDKYEDKPSKRYDV